MDPLDNRSAYKLELKYHPCVCCVLIFAPVFDGIAANLCRWSHARSQLYTLRASFSTNECARNDRYAEDECVWKILNSITHIWWWCYHDQPRLIYRFNQYQHNALSLRYIAQPFAGSEKLPNVIIIKWWMFYRAERVCECDLLPGAIIISTHPPTLDHKYVFGRSLSTHKPVEARIAPCENKTFVCFIVPLPSETPLNHPTQQSPHLARRCSFSRQAFN